MRKLTNSILGAALGLLLFAAVNANAQTNTSTSWITALAGDVKTFFTDQTNLFNQGTVAFEAGPVVNLSNYKIGADFDVQFPIAQQASVGFDVLYFNGHAYDGVINTTLGTTWNLPLINQPVYTYAQVGVGTDLQNCNNVINEQWAGVKWKRAFSGSLTNLSLTLKGAVGHISGEPGALVKGMAGLEWRF